jgi:hypothetical protein
MLSCVTIASLTYIGLKNSCPFFDNIALGAAVRDVKDSPVFSFAYRNVLELGV